ncbi:hypothetical protein [Metabacillus halosaccharovorans]|uniref:hypothetical protein n=1 Tax=Metabacillus halosaccharovorans TaxID=930124 RepID=UPI001C1FC08D|nr:hypothetical protein [Metabacillus halosaccharovorans]MBU7592812.1 hypothetical protein [Metabacillus halosaccharovorans]
MDLLLWLTVGFIIIGFFVLVSMKKSMERRVTLIIVNEKNIESEQVSNKPVIWWITGATVWGIVSMFLIVRSFSVYM